VHSPTTSWTGKIQWPRCSHGPWGSTILISSLSMKVQKVKVVRRLTSYFLLPNLAVMSDHRFLDGISSYLLTPIKVKVLIFPASSSYLTVVSDHRSPDGISSVDSIPIRDFLGPCTLTSSFQVLDDVFKEGISMGRFTQGTI
jgi:hypothetical protein